MIVTVKEMKNYLRVDFDDDDVLLSDLIEQGQQRTGSGIHLSLMEN